jgi:hypothetical protein
MAIADALGHARDPLAESAIGRLLKHEENPTVVAELCSALCEMCTTEQLEALRAVVNEDRYDARMADIQESVVTLAKMVDYHPPELEKWESDLRQKVSDRAKQVGLFSGPEKWESQNQLPDTRELLDRYDPDAPQPVRTGTAKVGRNDPCPCGSGKKYKKCCLNNG